MKTLLPRERTSAWQNNECVCGQRQLFVCCVLCVFCMCVCVRVYVRACVCVCVRACVRVWTLSKQAGALVDQDQNLYMISFNII